MDLEQDGYPPLNSQEWVTLEFRDQHGKAAEYLYSHTSLQYSPIVMPRLDSVGTFVGASINPNIMPSSGEQQILLPMLWGLSTTSHRIPPPLFFSCVDEETRKACWFSLGIALGLIQGVMDFEAAS